jgi:hypothetical protein
MFAFTRSATLFNKCLIALLLVAFVGAQTAAQHHVHAETESHCSVCTAPDQSPAVDSSNPPQRMRLEQLSAQPSVRAQTGCSITQTFHSRAPPAAQHTA